MASWKDLNQQIIDCSRCKRLLNHCENVAKVKRRSYIEEDYWGKPVPNFGVARSKLLIVGLAPGAHGANRTGRMFTGDRSGDWLYRALYRAGFCNQSESFSIDDGLKMKKTAITAVCHCAPPDNKPMPDEIKNCSDYLADTISIVRPRVFLALGGIAWKALIRFAIQCDWWSGRQPKFGHGTKVRLVDARSGKPTRWLIGCYHPSQQNTFTGRLTEEMLDKLMSDVKSLLDKSS